METSASFEARSAPRSYPTRSGHSPSTAAMHFPPPWTAEETDACFIVRDAQRAGARARLFRGQQCYTVEELMREALLFVIVVAMVATGLWLFVAGLFFRKRNQHLVRCQWRLADRFGWRPVVEGFRRTLLGLRRRLNDANDL